MMIRCSNPNCSGEMPDNVSFCSVCREYAGHADWGAVLLSKTATGVGIALLFGILFFKPTFVVIAIYFSWLFMLGIVYSWRKRSGQQIAFISYTILVFMVLLLPSYNMLPFIAPAVCILSVFILAINPNFSHRWLSVGNIFVVTWAIEQRLLGIIPESHISGVMGNLQIELLDNPRKLGSVLMGIGVGRAALFLVFVLIVHTGAKMAPCVSYDRIWPKLPAAPRFRARVNWPRWNIDIPLLGSIAEIALELVRLSFNAAAALVDVIWLFSYGVANTAIIVVEILFRTAWYLARLLLQVMISCVREMLLSITEAISVMGDICLIVAIPLGAVAVEILLVVKTSQALAAHLNGARLADVFIWPMSATVFTVALFRFGGWILAPTGDVGWWMKDARVIRLSELLLSEESGVDVREYANTVSNFAEYYYLNRVLTGSVAAILVADLLGLFHIGPFRFGATMITTLVISLCVAAIQLVRFYLRRKQRPQVKW